MATVDKAFADNLVANQGYYNGDSGNSLGDNPRITRIVKYINGWGDEAYGITSEREDQNTYLKETKFVTKPEIYWEYKHENKEGIDSANAVHQVSQWIKIDGHNIPLYQVTDDGKIWVSELDTDSLKRYAQHALDVNKQSEFGTLDIIKAYHISVWYNGCFWQSCINFDEDTDEGITGNCCHHEKELEISVLRTFVESIFGTRVERLS